MSFTKVTLISIIQGLTEFIPISSSGHIVILSNILGFDVSSPVLFTLFLHIGTIISIFIFFIKRIELIIDKALKRDRETFLWLWYILISLFATGIVGLSLKGFIEKHFGDVKLVGGMLCINGFILLLTYILPKSSRELNTKIAIAIGIAQGIAVIPGISRSGSTITIGQVMGLDKIVAFEFSFLLSIPAVIGAFSFELSDLSWVKLSELVYCFYGMAISAITGYLALKILKSLLIRDLFIFFAIYCIIIGISILFI